MYTVTGMDLVVAVAGFITGIRVDVAIVATAVGVESVDKVGSLGKNWVGGHGLCSHCHLEPPLYWYFGSLLLFSHLGYWVFHDIFVEFLSGGKILVHGWLPSFPSSSK